MVSQCVNTAWVIPDILQSSMLALVTTRLKYIMEQECERRGVSGYVGAGRDGGAEQEYGALDKSARIVRVSSDVAVVYI